MDVNTAITRFLAMHLFADWSYLIAKVYDYQIGEMNVGDAVEFDFFFEIERKDTQIHFEVIKPSDCKILRKNNWDFACKLNVRSEKFPVIVEALASYAGRGFFEVDVNVLEGEIEFEFHMDDHVYEGSIGLGQFSFKLGPLLAANLKDKEQEFIDQLGPIIHWYDLVLNEKDRWISRSVCRFLCDHLPELKHTKFEHVRTLCSVQGDLSPAIRNLNIKIDDY